MHYTRKMNSFPTPTLVKMKRILTRKGRGDSGAPLLRSMEEDRPDSTQVLNALDQNSINTQIEDLHSGAQAGGGGIGEGTGHQSDVRALDRDTLCDLLGVPPDAPAVIHCNSDRDSDLDPDLVSGLIEESVRTHLPQPPSDEHKDLQRHLLAVQSVVQKELVRRAPLLSRHSLLRELTQSYHRAVLRQMNELLLQTSSSKTCLQLLRWVLQDYLSEDMFSPDLFKHLDLILYSDWIQAAQNKYLRLLKEDISSQLSQILERETQPCISEENYIETYIDVIQYIDAAPTAAQRLSSELSLTLTDFCLNELRSFLHSYKSHCFEILAGHTSPEPITFLKISKTCRELKKYLKTKANRDRLNTVQESVLILEETEAFTLKTLLQIWTLFTESRLKEYFKSRHSSKMFSLGDFFPLNPWISFEEHKELVCSCYRQTVGVYSKLLMARSLGYWRRSWTASVASCVSEDAEAIHTIFTKVCPGLERWHLLDYISELLVSSLDVKKLIAAKILEESNNNTSCTELMPQMTSLIRWLGLSRSQTREVWLALDLDSRPDQECLTTCFCFC